MKFQKLGKTDIDVSVVALGTWGLGGGSVWTDGDSTVEDAKRLLDICHEHGVNYIDTAPVYGTGVSEELLGKALKGRRNDFVLQTKCSLNWRNEGGNFHYERDGYTVNNDTRASAVKKDVEDSLRRWEPIIWILLSYIMSAAAFRWRKRLELWKIWFVKEKSAPMDFLTVSRQICLHIRKPAETYLLYRNFSVFSLLSMAEIILNCVKSITRYFRPMVCWKKDF